jgi:ankyrin repeat protein
LDHHTTRWNDPLVRWNYFFLYKTNPEKVKQYVNGGGDVCIRDFEDIILLHVACLNQPSLVPFLVEHGADVNAVDERTNTPLHYACRYAYSVVEYLVNHGADVNIKTEGVTPLCIACEFEAPEKAIQLLYVRSNEIPHDRWPSLNKIIALYSGMCWKRSEVGGLPSCFMTSYIYQDK